MLAVGLALAGAAPAGATIRLFSYDPADSATREASGPLTFQFDQTLLGSRIQNVRATEGEAKAVLKPADPRALGPGGLGRVIGAREREHDLYEVLPLDQGTALAAALCPGSKRAWMALGRLRLNRDLKVFVLGDDPKTGLARSCRTLQFTFHGEWLLPPGRPYDSRDLDRPLFPR